MSDLLPCVFNLGLSEKTLKICIVYSRNPFPMMRGDQLTVAHLLSFLSSRGHIVDLVTLDLGGQVKPVQERWLAENCRNVHRIGHNYRDVLVGLARGLRKLLPLQVSLFHSAKQDFLVKTLDSKDKYDVIYAYYLRSAEVTKSYDGRNLLALQLSQTLNTKRISANTRSFFKKIIYAVEAFLVERYEGKIWRSFRQVALIGEKDVESIEAASAAHCDEKISNWFYSAHGTDISKFKPALLNEVVKGRIVFSGSMMYEPNVQAVLWFVKNCWPEIKKAFENAQFYIVGRDPTFEIIQLGNKQGIEVTGTVDDPSRYIRSADVCINPIQAAGGMQNKLIEYMASEKIVVCTSIANEAIKAPIDAVVLADSAELFTSSINRILRDPKLFAPVARKAKEYVEDFWTWDHHFLKLEKNLIKMSKHS